LLFFLCPQRAKNAVFSIEKRVFTDKGEGVELVHDVNFTVMTLSIVKAEVEVSEDEDLEAAEGAVAESGEAAAE